ncbi:MAG: AAA family ATPase [Desulfamplus sp.]|nr:AAA family ATPase [Desulfamplus sp.]
MNFSYELSGNEVVEAIKIAKTGNIPVILSGRHGVGKSTLVAQAALELKIDILSPNLASTDPTDFTGVPYIKDGRTVYAPSEMLPAENSKGGIFFLDEVNRADTRQRSFLYQLLEERSLNRYKMPMTWLPVAAINDNSDSYDIYSIDEAFSSRFIKIQVVAPSPVHWAIWAKKNGCHPTIIEFVKNCPEVFEPPSCPRNFSKVSSIFKAYESYETNINVKNEKIFISMIQGILGERLGIALFQFYRNQYNKPLSGQSIAENFSSLGPIISRWFSESRMDIISACVENIKQYFQHCNENNLVISKQQWKNIEDFLSVVPGDMQSNFMDWLEQCQHLPYENLNQENLI